MILDLPEEVVEALGAGSSITSASVLTELACSLYQRGSLSGGQTAAVLGMNRREFQELLSRRPTIPPFDSSDFEAELSRLGS